MSGSINFSQFRPFNIVNSQFLSEMAVHVQIFTVPKGTMLFKRSKSLVDSYYLIDGEIDLIDNQYGIELVGSDSIRAKNALNTETPSPVSAVAKSVVTYFVIQTQIIERLVLAQSKDELERAPIDDKVCESDVWMDDLLQCPVFSKIPGRHLQNLFTQFQRVYVQGGEVIVKEGDPGDYFYVISAGSVEVTNHAGNVSVILKAGEYFGEEALISDSPRNATVTMLENGILQKLNSEDFNALVKIPVLKYVAPDNLDTLDTEYQILDVRMPIEYRMAHFPGSINVPISRLRKCIANLEHEQTYIISDEGGTRTDVAAYLLCQAGFDACVLTGAAPDQRLSNV